MDTMRAAYDEVYVYTIGRPGFILQHVVDAFAVQTVNQDSKPISVVFGLVGLYLHVEKQFSGRQVQKVHMKLGSRKREWPSIWRDICRGGIKFGGASKSMATYACKTSDSVQQVLAFYRDKFGPKVTVVETPDGALVTSSKNENESVMVTIGRDESDGKTSLTISHATSTKDQ